MVSRIFSENIDFYLNITLQWLVEQHQGITTCLVSYPQFPHTLLQDHFVKLYQERIGGYLIPNTVHTTLDNYGKIRQSNELDIVSYLNFSHTKTLI